ncbi:hypothetical protein H6G89_04570 [Oscillatoria sp. FACHB-1407]|uniref:hypothetical protein n=1 Tax=Oscillatoria sp. FACHB-1407 TaxID=2692847 RepID=UPI001685394D|nr:hypothetical protein [Oscillatoria sp. FACHB-1407]MBD2460311.1 hypothetical protein [Oscillatoria sp. FACHB-1407]
MNRFIAWIEKASERLAISLITIIFVASAVVFAIAPSAAARSLAPETESYAYSGNTGEWTSSPLPAEKTRQAAPMPAENTRQTHNAQDNLRRNVRDAADNVQDALDPDAAGSRTKGFFNQVKNRVDTAVENTKDAFGGAGDDVRDTLKDASEPARYPARY